MGIQGLGFRIQGLGVLLGLYRGSMGNILGYWGLYRGYVGVLWAMTYLTRGFEKGLYKDFLGVILGFNGG